MLWEHFVFKLNIAQPLLHLGALPAHRNILVTLITCKEWIPILSSDQVFETPSVCGQNGTSPTIVRLSAFSKTLALRPLFKVIMTFFAILPTLYLVSLPLLRVLPPASIRILLDVAEISGE
jgi:hypothetical protein